MPTELSKVKRAIRAGSFELGLHFLEELNADELTIAEVVSGRSECLGIGKKSFLQDRL